MNQKPLVRIAKADMGMALSLRRWSWIRVGLRTDDGPTELFLAGATDGAPDASGKEAVLDKLHEFVNKLPAS